jgi:hypothetical protein
MRKALLAAVVGVLALGGCSEIAGQVISELIYQAAQPIEGQP